MRIPTRLHAVFISLVLVAVLATGALPAQEVPPAGEPAEAADAAPADSGELPPPAEAQAPPSGAGAFDAEAATRAYLDRLSPEEKARSDAYFEGGYWLQLWGLLYGLGVAWLFLGTRLSARMRDLAEWITRRGPLRTALYAIQYTVIATVLGFPLAVYQGFFREHRYGLATQTFPEWLRDHGWGFVVGVILAALALPIFYGVIRKAPRTWWLWGTVVGVIFLAFTVLVSPVYIDPLFNTFEPLGDPEVREPILSLARANGVPADEVWQFDASRQSTRISANVSGFLGTMRIRLNDNLLERCTLPEIEAVMAHEIGHYALNHIYEMLISLGLVLAGGFAFVHFGFGRVLRRWGGRWGVRDVGDVAGLPLLGALLTVYFFVMTPVFKTIIRVNEAEADLFGLNAARQPDGFAEVSLKLAEYRKLEPGPIEEWLFFDHPSGRSRIRMAMEWKAEHLGEAAGGAGGD
jgi:STE24 endopeptidase